MMGEERPDDSRRRSRQGGAAAGEWRVYIVEWGKPAVVWTFGRGGKKLAGPPR